MHDFKHVTSTTKNTQTYQCYRST